MVGTLFSAQVLTTGQITRAVERAMVRSCHPALVCSAFLLQLPSPVRLNPFTQSHSWLCSPAGFVPSQLLMPFL